jgi:hypothetical protein
MTIGWASAWEFTTCLATGSGSDEQPDKEKATKQTKAKKADNFFIVCLPSLARKFRQTYKIRPNN